MIAMRSLGFIATLAALLIADVSGQIVPPTREARTGDGNGCNAPMADPIVHVAVSGAPWSVVSTQDGCWLFVAMGGGGSNPVPAKNGIEVLRRNGGAITPVRFVPTPGKMADVALTRDEKLLLVPAGPRIALLNVDKLLSGDADPAAGFLGDEHDRLGGAGAVSVSPDGRRAFVSERETARISMFELDAARGTSSGTASAAARIPLGGFGQFALSPEGRYLYATSLLPPEPYRFEGSCRGTTFPGEYRRPGALMVMDLTAATTSGTPRVVATVAAGCGPKGVTVSPDGSTVYVTANEDERLLAFDVRRIADGMAPTLKFTSHSGPMPAQSLVIDSGRRIIVVNSLETETRGMPEAHPMTVFDTATGREIGSIPTRVGPAKASVTHDGRTVLLANREAGTLEIVDLQRALAAPTTANATECAQPLTLPNTYIATPNQPAHVAVTRDGCWMFVRSALGVSTFRRRNGNIEPSGGLVALPGASGMDLALTRDERMLVVRAPGRLVFFDVGRLMSGADEPALGSIGSNRFPTSSTPGQSLVVTADDKHLIATNHSTSWLTVIDLDRVRKQGPSDSAVVLGVPVGSYATGPVLSADDQRLLLPLGRAPEEFKTPATCLATLPALRGDRFRPGALQVIDIARLLSAGQDASLFTFVTGCEPTSAAAAPDGDTIYVASRSDDALLAFAVHKGPPESAPSLIGTVPVLATGPTDIAIAEQGRTVIVSNSHDRDSGPTFLTVIDAARVSEGRTAVRGIIPTRSRKIPTVVVATDGHTLFVPNREANLLQIVDLQRVLLDPVPTSVAAR
jgi:DNA-binding beta-propeller fold protein YncE